MYCRPLFLASRRYIKFTAGGVVKVTLATVLRKTQMQNPDASFNSWNTIATTYHSLAQATDPTMTFTATTTTTTTIITTTINKSILVSSPLSESATSAITAANSNEATAKKANPSNVKHHCLEDNIGIWYFKRTARVIVIVAFLLLQETHTFH